MLWRGFQKPKRLAVEAETLSDTFGKFSAQPFERGFGTTIGNALRRTLLSSIEGAAVTAVRIEGVLHEFQSITGVVEDATDIILNLKQVPFKLAGEGPKALYLRADQPGIVTSGMIEADGDVEILDKDIYIATLSEGGKLDMFPPRFADATMFCITISASFLIGMPPFFSLLTTSCTASLDCFSDFAPVQTIFPELKIRVAVFGVFSLKTSPGNWSGWYSTSTKFLVIRFRSALSS